MTRYRLTGKGRAAVAADEARRFITVEQAVRYTRRPLNEIHDLIYHQKVSWGIDPYGNVLVDAEDAARYRREPSHA
ncbi:hypothetical protein [Corynebacterium kalidii]